MRGVREEVRDEVQFVGIQSYKARKLIGIGSNGISGCLLVGCSAHTQDARPRPNMKGTVGTGE